MNTLIAKKVGMTQIFDENAKAMGVTVLDVSDCRVVQVKNEKVDGYNAVQLTIGKTKTIENPNSINFTYQHSVIKDNVSKLGVIVCLETSENNEQINSFGKQLSMHIAASNPLALEANEINKEIIEKEQNLIAEELKNSGKSEEIANKISLGKLNKFKEENSLLTQNWVMEPKKKVKEVISEINVSNLKIKEFSRIKIGE